MSSSTHWFDTLEKPSWTPEELSIRLVWHIFYPLLYLVNIGVIYHMFFGDFGWRQAVPFWINLLVTLSFMPILNRFRSLWLSLFNLMLVWISIIDCLVIIHPYSQMMFLAYEVYFMWATALGFLLFKLAWLNSRPEYEIKIERPKFGQ